MGIPSSVDLVCSDPAHLVTSFTNGEIGIFNMETRQLVLSLESNLEAGKRGQLQFGELMQKRQHMLPVCYDITCSSITAHSGINFSLASYSKTHRNLHMSSIRWNLLWGLKIMFKKYTCVGNIPRKLLLWDGSRTYFQVKLVLDFIPTSSGVW